MEHVNKVLSSYFTLGNQAYEAASSIDLNTDEIHSFLRWFLLDIPVVPVLLAFHSMNASLKVHSILPPHTFWLKSLVVTMFAAFGGSTLAAVLTGRPAPLFSHASNFMMSYIFISWYLIHKSWMIRSFLSFRPIQAILAFGASAARARSIFSFIDDYTREFPRVVAGAIICGGLSGSGGQLFVSIERMFHEQGPSAALSDFSAPGWGFKSAYFAAALYYYLIDPDDLVYQWLPILPTIDIDRATARFYISTALCFHAAFETLYGTHINPLFWLESIFASLTGLKRHPSFHSKDDDNEKEEENRSGNNENFESTTVCEENENGTTRTSSTSRTKGKSKQRPGYVKASGVLGSNSNANGDAPTVLDEGLRRRR